MRVLLAVPTFENIQPEVFEAIYNLDTSGYRADFTFVRGYDCAKARCGIAQKAMEGDYHYVMMIDSDTIVPRDALQIMLSEPADVILGCCPRKNTKESKTALYALSENPSGFKKALTYGQLGKSRIELRGGGFACALVRVDVFRRMRMPYFNYVVYENGEALSEDLYFCLEARRAGFHIWGEPNVRCGHMARFFQYE